MTTKTTAEPRELLVKLARRRFGDDWLAGLADLAEVTQRTVRRWAAGETRVPGSVLKLLKGG